MNKRFLPLLILSGLFLVSFFSCKKESDDKYANNVSAGYFPLEVGHYVTYNVDSVIWNDFDCTIDTNHYQMRFTIADTFFDNASRKSYRIETSIRSGDTVSWNPGTVMYVTPTATGLEYVENNLRYIKLTYPIVEGNSWDGNSMILTNDQDYSFMAGWNYKYANYKQSYDQDGVSFDNTVTVNQVDETQNNPETQPNDYAYRTYSKEVYAYGIGMVYRAWTHWIYDPGVKTCRKGSSVVMRAVDHN